MHPYSIETEERKNVSLILAVISIVLAWSFHQLMSFFEIDLQWWLESPSVLFFYSLLYTIFDKWCWKWLRKIGLIRTPDLNGEWSGTLKTSFDSHSSELKTTLKIFRTWTKIKTILTADHSVSYSEAASMILEAPEGKYLSYQYVNEPKLSAVQTMSIHRGTTKLLFDEKTDTLSGEYYSGRDRQNFGSLNLKRRT